MWSQDRCECDGVNEIPEPAEDNPHACGTCGLPFDDWFERGDDYRESFTAGYAVAMLWANTHDESGESYPDHYEGLAAFSPDSQLSITADCAEFVSANWDDLADLDASQAGHDFALTRNHHGAGFWDRGLGERGDRLTAASHPYGESSAWFDDAGIVYLD